MKKSLSLLLIFAVIITLFSACNKPQEPVEEEHEYGKIIYVSPDGNDENNGEKGSPVASLVGAVKAMRDYRSQNGLPEGGIKIEFAEGTYYVTEGITLTAEDSGTEESPIVFAGADGANVIFNGGVTLNPADFVPADEDFKALLQTEEAKKNVVMIDLAKAGCYDLDDTKPYDESEYYRQELFVNGKRQTLARWPNGEYCHPETSIQKNSQFGKIIIPDDKAEIWRTLDKIWYFGYPFNDFKEVWFTDIDVDPDSSALLYPMDYEEGLKQNCPYYVSNIPQELDSPGEYYWDTKTNIVYYYPDKEFENSSIVFSQYNDVPVTFSDCSYLTFENIRGSYFRNGFISGTGDFVIFRNCEISSLSGYSAVNLKGDNVMIRGCYLHDVSTNGFILASGDISTQTFGNSVITDNIASDWAQIYTSFNGAIIVEGYGTVVAHNELFSSSTLAIDVHAGQCIIEYNDIHDCLRENSDCGAIHTSGRFSWYDNVYRYNYIHEIKDIVRSFYGNGIYFDAWGRFASAYGNLFYNVAGTALCGASGYMDLHDNICINVGAPINIVYWGPEEKPNIYDEAWLKDDIRLYDYHSQLWRYTSSRTLLFVEVNNQDENYTSYDLPQSPSHFYIRNNVRYIDGSSSFKPFDEEKEDPYMFYTVSGLPWAFNLSAITDNACYWEDPGFTDYANGDYTLRKDSRVFRDLIGFEEPDLSTVGARASENPFK